jgi:hypothetical protein
MDVMDVSGEQQNEIDHSIYKVSLDEHGVPTHKKQCEYQQSFGIVFIIHSGGVER